MVSICTCNRFDLQDDLFARLDLPNRFKNHLTRNHFRFPSYNLRWLDAIRELREEID